MVDGSAVSIGSSISATGRMLVDCNKPYELKVDGVLWQPIGQEDSKDVYLISSSGQFVITVDDVRVFFFRNEIEQDFVLEDVRGSWRTGTTAIAHFYGHPYLQTPWRSGDDYDNLDIYIPSDDAEAMATLGASSNNGTIQIVTNTPGYLRLVVREFDKSTYMQVKVGNVLVAFITTVS